MALLGSLFGGSKPKYTPIAAPAAPSTPTSADTSIASAGAAARSAASGGLADTVKTSGQGAPASGAVAYKSLLGE